MAKGKILCVLMGAVLFVTSPLALAIPPSPSSATNSKSPDSYSYNAEAFRRARALCQDVQAINATEPEQTSIDYLGLMKFALSGAKTGFFFWRPESFKVTPETADFVNSDGFKSAMYACFENNEAKQKAFKGTILAMDFIGHLAGVTIWIFPTAWVARMFKRVSWVTNNPLLMKKIERFVSVSNRLGILAVAGTLGYQIWSSYQERADGKERLGELTENIVDASEQESEDSYAILQKILDETNSELKQMQPGDPRAPALLKRQSILEDRLKGHPVTTSLDE